MIQQGVKNIFIEKPGSNNLRNLKKLSRFNNINIHIGFNHRYIESILYLKKIYNKLSFGKLLFIRANYGHGGRKNYQLEWRMKKKISGGGQLIDQGSHLIDLIHYLFKKNSICFKFSYLKSLYWSRNVEDLSLLILEIDKKIPVLLTNSWIEWKNQFKIEFFFEKGLIHLDGLGGYYGDQKISKIKKLNSDPFIKTSTKTFKNNNSLFNEQKFFIKQLKSKKFISNLNDAISLHEILDKAYK